MCVWGGGGNEVGTKFTFLVKGDTAFCDYVRYVSTKSASDFLVATILYVTVYVARIYTYLGFVSAENSCCHWMRTPMVTMSSSESCTQLFGQALTETCKW